MSRTGLFVMLALLIAAGAAAALFWTGVLTGKVDEPPVVIPSSDLGSTSRDAQLVNEMRTAAVGGGYSASFSEQDVGKWQIAEGHKIERFSAGQSGSVFARLTSSGALDKSSVQWPTLGLSATLPVEFATATAGKKLEIGIIARSSQSNGSAALSVNFATRQAGNSGWQDIPLKPDFELFKFEYNVPVVETGYTNGPMIVLHSDATGSGNSAELIGIYVKVVD
jgi:hypothetical protein